MKSNKYRIRLYGQSSKDPWKFCNNMASIVGVGKEAARALLAKAPVVIMEDLERDRGEALLETIRYIGGLCVMEPMSGSAGADELFAALSPELSGSANHRRHSGFNAQTISAGRIAATAITLALIFVMVGALFKPGGKIEVDGLRVISSPVESYDLQEHNRRGQALDHLWSSYENLKTHTEFLRYEFKRTKDELDNLRVSYPYPSKDKLREKKRDAMIAKENLDYNLRRLKRLAKKIRSMEYMESLSIERKTGLTRTAWKN